MTAVTVDFEAGLASPFEGIDERAVAAIGPVTRGKVRDVVDLGDYLALIATDRLSAFDRVLGTVPYRGQVLNQLAAWWFERITDLVSSHVVAVPDPNLMIGRKCQTLPVEVVVRAFLSGSTDTALWTRYAGGAREIYGRRYADGMAKNDPLPEPVITPTTKAGSGAHDEPISESEIVARGVADAAAWAEIRETALAVFDRGRRIAATGGLVLVDTKYEFGYDNEGRLTMIDEVHTPDSSRFWRAETVAGRRAAGQEPENLDKEVVRLEYRARGYRGEGEPPPLDDELSRRAAAVYCEAFERLTGSALVPGRYPAGPRVAEALRAWVR